MENRKFHKFDELFNIFKNKLVQVFEPGVNLCVDEQLNSFRGKCSFRQFMPSKPAKYGLKIWVVVCNETGIACDVNIYLGKTEAREDSNKVGENVLLLIIL